MITPNTPIQQLWADLMIEEAVRLGCTYFVICPGSRSTPLTIAAARHPQAQHKIHFDERGAAFHALGYSAATGSPCAIITTSGTAVANCFPAVIEASKKKLPLLVLTADRPPELRATGAHQTIDQVGIFGQYVRWQCDMPCPTTEIPAAFVLTTLDQALAQAQNNLRGPVHLNCMFREPLTPSPTKKSLSRYLSPLTRWISSTEPYTRYTQTTPTIPSEDIARIAKTIKGWKRGIIVVGKIGAGEQDAVMALATRLGYPVFPDITSGLRHGPTTLMLVPYFDFLLSSKKLRAELNPDGILHLGGRITSKRWYSFIEETQPQSYIMVLNHPLRSDPLHTVSDRCQMPVGDFCQTLIPHLTAAKKPVTIKSLQKLNKKIDLHLDQALKTENIIGPVVARMISRLIPEHQALFLASSLSVREMDLYAAVNTSSIPISSNRGASGIDGTIATATGYATGLKRCVTLFIGDLALLHDLNSLSMLADAERPLVIVVLNNRGGGIFSFLPIAKTKDVFEPFFATPHTMTFESASQMFGLNYADPHTPEGFKEAYRQALDSEHSTIIELNADRTETHQFCETLRTNIIQIIEQK